MSGSLPFVEQILAFFIFDLRKKKIYRNNEFRQTAQCTASPTSRRRCTLHTVYDNIQFFVLSPSRKTTFSMSIYYANIFIVCLKKNHYKRSADSEDVSFVLIMLDNYISKKISHQFLDFLSIFFSFRSSIIFFDIGRFRLRITLYKNNEELKIIKLASNYIVTYLFRLF